MVIKDTETVKDTGQKVFYEISAPVNSPEKIHQPGFMWYDK
jgi:hypothetical protein|tara:strand:+ start:1788 stop:1910 length:123 start_codon:yes stop_codon:yes gene_type:complete